MRRRAIVVRRSTELDELMDRYSTCNQVEFVPHSRGRILESVECTHESHVTAPARVRADIPDEWASANVERDSLSRFLLAPEDVIAVVRPDGPVTNVAKYVDTRAVVGINPVLESQAGVLVRCASEEGACALRRLDEDTDLRAGRLTMVQVSVDNSRLLRTLNEVFIGHPSHQSARYKLRFGSVVERQSSSGLVVSTGIGTTGWRVSLKLGRHMGELPAPTSCSFA